jgi:membrane dipeptidase
LFYVLDEPYTQQALDGGVNVINVTFGTEEDWNSCLSNFHRGLEKIKNPLLKLALCANDVLAAQREGTLAVVIGAQDSAMLCAEIYRLEFFVV